MNNFGIIDGLLLAHASPGGAAASDYTGVLALAVGAVLAALAIPILHLGEGTATRGRALAYRAALVVAGSLVVYGLVSPFTKVVGTHEHRKSIGDLQGVSLPGELPRTPGPEAAAIGRSGPVRAGGPEEYERRVIAFFDRTLLQPTPNGRSNP